MTRCRIGCVVAALLLAVPVGATSIVRVADEAMVEQAPLVVVARMVDSGPAATARPATEYRFAVEQVLKGVVGPELTLRVPGGLGADGIGLRIHGAPSFAPGERAILFLEGRDGGHYRVLHLMQGAFREVRHEGRSLALRDLADVTEVSVQGGRIDSAAAAAGEQVRDFDAFAAWIAERAGGRLRAADYLVSTPSAGEGSQRVAAPFTLLRDAIDGTPLRWFAFDTGGSIEWRSSGAGQSGVPGGGVQEFRASLQIWNAESRTPIDYRYGGTTTATGGLAVDDGVNAIHFNDPNDELTNLSPGCSGTIGLGGGSYFADPRTFRGQTYYEWGEADIVINNGLECFFGAGNASKLAEQLFTHELGHTLGLGHSCGDKGISCADPVLNDALMRATVHNDARGGQLRSDDIAGIRLLYQQSGGNQGQGTPPAAPTGLTAVPLSTTEILLTWEDESNDETGFVIEMKLLGGAFAAIATMDANSTGAEVFNLSPATGHVFRVRATNAHGTSAPGNEAQASTNALPGACFPGAQALCLANGRFQVDADWMTTQGTSGKGQVVPNVATDDSGLFYFFTQANWEVVVKVLDACVVNDRFWVFAGGLTNVQVTLRVIDTQTGAVRHYFNPQTTAFQPVQDIGAFATCSGGPNI